MDKHILLSQQVLRNLFPYKELIEVVGRIIYNFFLNSVYKEIKTKTRK